MSHEMGIFPNGLTDSEILTTKTNNTAEATQRKPEVAQVKSELDKVWTKNMEAEERSKLLRTLIKEGIGTRELESYVGRQSLRKFGEGKG